MKFYHKHIEHDDPLRENASNHILLEHKYRILWELRHLEKEINADGGIIVFHGETSEVETINFSPELDKRIWDIIRSIDWSKW